MLRALLLGGTRPEAASLPHVPRELRLVQTGAGLPEEASLGPLSFLWCLARSVTYF